MPKYLLKDPNAIVIDKRVRSTLERVMSAGASRQLIDHEPFFLKDHLINFSVATSRNHRQVSKRAQFASYSELWDEPFGLPYIMCISSAPNDVMAQMVAFRFMLRATAKAVEQKRGRPMWHPVFGGIAHDKMRDTEKDRSISMLFLTNVPNNSTPYKIEKLRDILTRYSHIPRVVVTTDEDPASFMTDYLKMPAHRLLYLGAKKEKRI